MSISETFQQQVYAEFSRQIPLNQIKTLYRSHILENSELKTFKPGDILFRKGERKQAELFLIEGEIENVYLSGRAERKTAAQVTTVLSSERFHDFSCVCYQSALVLVVDSELLDECLSWSQISDFILSDVCMDTDRFDDLDWINTVLNSNLFVKVPPVNAERILDKMKPELVEAGDCIVRQGEVGDCCYFIKEGNAKVERYVEGEGHVHLADISVGRCFGEDALVFDTLRNATVTMTSAGTLMRLDKTDFMPLMEMPEVDELEEHEISDSLEKTVLLDVRTQAEYEAGHLSLAANLPLGLLALKARLLRENIHYVIYCDTGKRSYAAAYLLGKKGYNTSALKGGLNTAGMHYQLINDHGYILKNGEPVQDAKV